MGRVVLGGDRSFDLVPARLTTPGRSYDAIRIYARNGIMALWKSENGKAVLERAVPIASIARVVEGRGSRGPWNVTLESGEVWTCERGGGCACGSPVRKADVARMHPTTVSA